MKLVESARNELDRWVSVHEPNGLLLRSSGIGVEDGPWLLVSSEDIKRVASRFRINRFASNARRVYSGSRDPALGKNPVYGRDAICGPCRHGQRSRGGDKDLARAAFAGLPIYWHRGYAGNKNGGWFVWCEREDLDRFLQGKESVAGEHAQSEQIKIPQEDPLRDNGAMPTAPGSAQRLEDVSQRLERMERAVAKIGDGIEALLREWRGN